MLAYGRMDGTSIAQASRLYLWITKRERRNPDILSHKIIIYSPLIPSGTFVSFLVICLSHVPFLSEPIDTLITKDISLVDSFVSQDISRDIYF